MWLACKGQYCASAAVCEVAHIWVAWQLAPATSALPLHGSATLRVFIPQILNLYSCSTGNKQHALHLLGMRCW